MKKKKKQKKSDFEGCFLVMLRDAYNNIVNGIDVKESLLEIKVQLSMVLKVCSMLLKSLGTAWQSIDKSLMICSAHLGATSTWKRVASGKSSSTPVGLSPLVIRDR